MQRAGALLLFCICLVACVAPRTHEEPKAEHTRADCSGCHEREYRAAPHHVDTKPTRCAVCHSETSWQPTQVNHAWALTGAHAKADCAACHKGWAPQYEHTDRTCTGCHRAAFEKAAVPGHAQVLLSSICQDCHDSDAWRPARQQKRTLLQPSAAAASQVMQVQGHAAIAAPNAAAHATDAAKSAASAPAPAQRADVATATAAPPMQYGNTAAASARQPAAPGASATPRAAHTPTAAPSAGAPTPQAQVVAATASEPTTTSTFGRSAKALGRRARRSDSKKKRARGTTTAASENMPELAEPPSAAAHAQAARPAAAASSLARPATDAKPSATKPAPAQPTAARAASTTFASRGSRPPDATKAPADRALRPQPPAAAGRSSSTTSSVAAARVEAAAPQSGEGHKPLSATGQAARTPESTTKSAAKAATK